MKFVYVLTSSENDVYYEQFLLSITSLRLYNPGAYIIVLLDQNTKNTLTGKRSEYEKIVSEIKVLSGPEFYSQKEISRWIKTSIRRYLTGDFLFIDCDTIITGSLEYDFPPDIKIGAVQDTHVPLSKNALFNQFRHEDKQAGFNSSIETDSRYNGGLIYCKDIPEAYQFFEKWYALWKEGLKKGISQDMPSLNQANYELNNIITELDGIWNCQISKNGLPFLYNAKIIHYFAANLDFTAPAFIPADGSTFADIKEKGFVSDAVMRLLKNPKAAFVPMTRVIADPHYMDVIDSSFFTLLILMRKKLPKFFKVINAFGNNAKYFVKKHLEKKKRSLNSGVIFKKLK
jgi:lipopolysaccharide biosynthesis glycosyltransferase